MLDNKMIKAIRLVNGFTDDLRIKLVHANKNALFDFIDENRAGIFGLSHELFNKPDPTSDEWQAWERGIWKAVKEVRGC